MGSFEGEDRAERADLILLAIDRPSSLRTLAIAAVVILAFGTLLAAAVMTASGSIRPSVGSEPEA